MPSRVTDRQQPGCITNPFCQFNQHLCRKWDQRFEAAFLQRRVVSEPGPRGCAVLKLDQDV